MSIDDTRQRIGADKMRDSEKKELFQKFQDHGGKVVNENRAKRQQMFDKQKQRDFLDKQKKDRPSSRGDRYSAISKSSIKKEKKGVFGRLKGLFNKLHLYIKSSSQGVISSGALSPKFFELLNGPAQSTLLDLELLLTPLTHAPNDLKQKLQNKLNTTRSFYYELLIRLKAIYDEREFKELLYKYRQNRYARILPLSIGEPLREFYKKIYILRNYEQSCSSALSQALEIQAEVEKKERVALKRNLQRGRKNINFVFSTLMPRLHLAVLNILKEYLHPGDKKINEFLNLEEKDQIGFLTEKISSEKKEAENKKEEFLKKRKEEEQKKQEEQIQVSALPEPVRNGFSLMKALPLSKEALVKSKDSIFGYLDTNNKMYTTEALFNEAEKEYIFLLASNQLKIAMAYQNGKKTDYKQELCDLAIEFDQIHEMIDEFNKNVIENYQIEKSPSYTLTQKSKLLHKISLNRSKANNQIRNRLAETTQKMETVLKRLLADYNSERHFLQNPEEIIDFDINMGSKKKLEGMKVIDSIVHIFHFMNAFRYRLTDGDLSGYGAKIEKKLVYEEEKAESSEQPETETASEEEPQN